jgi:hypothetical protein
MLQFKLKHFTPRILYILGLLDSGSRHSRVRNDADLRSGLRVSSFGFHVPELSPIHRHPVSPFRPAGASLPASPCQLQAVPRDLYILESQVTNHESRFFLFQNFSFLLFQKAGSDFALRTTPTMMISNEGSPETRPKISSSPTTSAMVETVHR